MFAERAEHPGLRKMHVAVDETGQDQPVGDGRDDQPYVPRGDLVMRSEVGDPAVLHDQKPVGVEARRFTLASDMPPGIVDEVEECAPDAERGPPPPLAAWPVLRRSKRLLLLEGKMSLGARSFPS